MSTDLSKLFAGGFKAMDAVATGFDLADPLSAFIDACRDNGIEIDHSFSPDGEIHRFPEQGSKRGEKDAWAVLHLDGPVPVGTFGSFKAGGWEKRWVANIGREMSLIERAETERWLSENKRRRDEAKRQMQDDAARRAEDEVGSLADASDDHPYLVRKGVSAHGIKIDRAGRLVIPITNADGEIQSYQRIDQDGSKRYLKGGKKIGGYYEIRGARSAIYVCEGFATGATVSKATGCSVFVAFDATNLAAVAKSVREMFPATKMFIAADNDQFTDGNPGLTKARAAAIEVGAEVVHPEFDESLMAQKPTDFNDLQQMSGIDEVRRYLGRQQVARKSQFELSHVAGLEITDVDYIIDGHIEADSLDLIFGEPGCGKSFVSIDMACCVATGTPWHGHEVKKGLVIYIAGEGHNGLAKRFKAWSIDRQVSLAGAPLFKSHRAAQLYDMSVAVDVAAAVQEVSEQVGEPPRLIIIDTVARNMGGDENSTQDMNQFIEHIDALLRHPYKAAVLLIHHSGKASPGQARGSTALRGALDAEFQVEMDDTTKMIQMRNRKMKDGEVPADKAFAIKKVGLGVLGKRGEEICGAALETVDLSGVLAQASNGGRDYLGKNQRKALVALEMLIRAREIDKHDVPVTLDDWREACKEHGIDRFGFRDSKDSLAAKRKVHINSAGVVTILPDEEREKPEDSHASSQSHTV